MHNDKQHYYGKIVLVKYKNEFDSVKGDFNKILQNKELYKTILELQILKNLGFQSNRCI